MMEKTGKESKVGNPNTMWETRDGLRLKQAQHKKLSRTQKHSEQRRKESGRQAPNPQNATSRPGAAEVATVLWFGSLCGICLFKALHWTDLN